MLVRWVLADGPPHPTAEVVKMADLPLTAPTGLYGRRRLPQAPRSPSDLGGHPEALLVGGDAARGGWPGRGPVSAKE